MGNTLKGRWDIRFHKSSKVWLLKVNNPQILQLHIFRITCVFRKNMTFSKYFSFCGDFHAKLSFFYTSNLLNFWRYMRHWTNICDYFLCIFWLLTVFCCHEVKIYLSLHVMWAYFTKFCPPKKLKMYQVFVHLESYFSIFLRIFLEKN